MWRPVTRFLHVLQGVVRDEDDVRVIDFVSRSQAQGLNSHVREDCDVQRQSCPSLRKLSGLCRKHPRPATTLDSGYWRDDVDRKTNVVCCQKRVCWRTIAAWPDRRGLRKRSRYVALEGRDYRTMCSVASCLKRCLAFSDDKYYRYCTCRKSNDDRDFDASAA